MAHWARSGPSRLPAPGGAREVGGLGEGGRAPAPNTEGRLGTWSNKKTEGERYLAWGAGSDSPSRKPAGDAVPTPARCTPRPDVPVPLTQRR